MKKVTNRNGIEIDYAASVNMMDDEIREDLHAEMVGTGATDQDFFTAYENRHESEFGEEWELSKSNPVW